jgi:FkbM family methyltransferase
VDRLRAALKHGPTASLYGKVAQRKRLLQDWAVTHVITSSKVVDTPYGFRLAASRYHANKQMQSGSFEPEEVRLIQKCLSDTEVFVDVGANIGYYTCLAAVAGKPVLAFEPQQRNLVNLYENIRLNQLKDVEVFPVALGAKAGIADLYGSSGPSASLLQGWGGNSSGYKQAVAVNTMDALIASRIQGKKAFIKIDVEGFEYQLLLGAKEIMAAQPKPTWLVEICLDEAHAGGLNADYEKTLGLFFDAGFRIVAADSNRTEVTRELAKKWQAEGKTPLGTYDYLISA